MFEELGRIAGKSGQDMGAFAQELQGLATGGGFNPFNLLVGEQRLHAAILAPLSPQLKQAIAQYLVDGTGPLQATVQQMQEQGLSASQAAERARELFQHAQGVCALVISHDQGLSVIPQLAFPQMDEAFMNALADALDDRFADKSAAKPLLGQLLAKLGGQPRFPETFATCDEPSDVLGFWHDLAERLVAALDEGIMPQMGHQQQDLAYWCQIALEQLYRDQEWDGDELLLAARCALVAWELDAAIGHIRHLLTEFEPEDEQVLHLLQHLAQVGTGLGRSREVVACLDQVYEHLDDLFGGPCYEVVLARFGCLTAAQGTAEELIAAGEALALADRKSFRHDLGREPLWRVTMDQPGEVIDTQEAAELVQRSPAFIAKRLEQGTIPTYLDGKELRIPRQALLAWQAVMTHFKLLD